jgi:hypothetical protein
MSSLPRPAIAAVAVAAATLALASPDAPTTPPPAPAQSVAAVRDPALWPFARTSPWNYPIGSRAEYAVIRSDLTSDGFHYLKLQGDRFTSSTWIGAATDPINEITRDDRPRGRNVFPQRVPAGAARAPGSDASISLIREDHLAAMDLEYAYRDRDGNWHGVGLTNVDLEGPGWGIDHMGVGGASCDGQTTAAGFPVMAGTIRPGELARGIRHALRFITNPHMWNRHAPTGQGYVWPAVAADTGWNAPDGYGDSGNLFIGSLVAIPLWVDVRRLGLVTPQAIVLADALQDYGAYGSDTDGRIITKMIIEMDYTARSELPANPRFDADLYIIARQLRVVTNSHSPSGGRPGGGGVKIDGGDERLSAPPAPPFDR